MKVSTNHQMSDRPSKRSRTVDSANEDDINIATPEGDTSLKKSVNVDHLTEHLEPNSLCDVCNRPFNEKYALVCLTCGRGPCQHTLGWSCTLELDLMIIEEECAACAPVTLQLRRTSLSSDGPQKALHNKTSTSGQQDKSPGVPGIKTEFSWKAWIEDINTHEGAEFFTKLMWVETSYLSHKARDGVTVYNSDIEECVVESLMRMSRHHPYWNKTFYLKQEHWPYFLSSTRVSNPPT